METNQKSTDQVPLVFSRTKFCPHCDNNQLPYSNKERLKRKNLIFVVKPSSESNPDALAVRRQSKPGIMGFTPHLFVIDEVIGTGDSKVYIVHTYCCVDGCGIRFEVHPNGDREVRFNDFNEKLKLTKSELVGRLKFKDPAYMLDYKEWQYRFDTRTFGELCPS